MYQVSSSQEVSHYCFHETHFGLIAQNKPIVYASKHKELHQGSTFMAKVKLLASQYQREKQLWQLKGQPMSLMSTQNLKTLLPCVLHRLWSSLSPPEMPVPKNVILNKQINKQKTLSKIPRKPFVPTRCFLEYNKKATLTGKHPGHLKISALLRSNQFMGGMIHLNATPLAPHHPPQKLKIIKFKT